MIFHICCCRVVYSCCYEWLNKFVVSLIVWHYICMPNANKFVFIFPKIRKEKKKNKQHHKRNERKIGVFFGVRSWPKKRWDSLSHVRKFCKRRRIWLGEKKWKPRKNVPFSISLLATFGFYYNIFVLKWMENILANDMVLPNPIVYIYMCEFAEVKIWRKKLCSRRKTRTCNPILTIHEIAKEQR